MAATMAASFRRLPPTQATMPVMTSLRPAHSMRPSVTPYFCKAGVRGSIPLVSTTLTSGYRTSAACGRGRGDRCGSGVRGGRLGASADRRSVGPARGDGAGLDAQVACAGRGVAGGFTGLLVAVDPDPVLPAPAGTGLADAVAAIVAAAVATVRRWDEVVSGLSPWELGVAVTSGQLLSPPGTPMSINTSRPLVR
jgi:hypothetical protein